MVDGSVGRTQGMRMPSSHRPVSFPRPVLVHDLILSDYTTIIRDYYYYSSDYY